MQASVNTTPLEQDGVQDGLPAGPRTWAIVALALGVGMSSLDTAIANTALPAMAQQLHASPADSVWIVNAYQLAMVATLLPIAALGETIGYRRVYVAGMALFTLASLACALAWSLPALIVARLFQGLGASAIMGVNTALLRATYPAKLQGRGFGNNALVVAIGFALGPSLASIILAASSWEWLFGINVIPGIIAFFLARRALPETRRASHRVDRVAGFYNVVAFAMAVLALGDSNYANYCGFGRQLDAWLAQGGATRLFDRNDVDRGDAHALAGWQHHVGRLAGTQDAPDWDAPAYADWRIVARTRLNAGSAGAPWFTGGRSAARRRTSPGASSHARAWSAAALRRAGSGRTRAVVPCRRPSGASAVRGGRPGCCRGRGRAACRRVSRGKCRR